MSKIQKICSLFFRLLEIITVHYFILKDPLVPKKVKLVCLSPIAYLTSPFDLFPELEYGVIGFADDGILLFITGNVFLHFIGREFTKTKTIAWRQRYCVQSKIDPVVR